VGDHGGARLSSPEGLVEQLPLGVRLRDRATFDSYEPGPNLEIVQHLRAVAAGRPGITWLWGPAGTGKTHLLQAVCAEAARAAPAGYLPLAELAGAGAAVLDGWGGVAALCVDDLDAVVGTAAFDRALFSLYRELEERGARLVVAACHAPAAMPWSLPDIASRFAASTVFQLRVLDEAEQLQAIRRRAAALGLELTDEVGRYLQRRLPRDIAALCRVIEQLDVAALAAQRRLTVPFIRAVLGEG
jgi:DnaA family protein